MSNYGLWINIDVSLKATAGLRQLKEEENQWIIREVRRVLRESGFRFNSSDTRVISGSEEALFGWYAVSHAFQANGFRDIIGVTDMGGASKQISYVLNGGSTAGQSDCKPDWILKHAGDKIGLVARSIEGMGLMAAMKTIIDHHEDGAAESQTCANNCSIAEESHHPCLAVGEHLPGSEIHDYEYSLQGHGDIEKCRELIRQTLLPKAILAVDLTCLKVFILF